jgi:hypothetical protein
MFFWENDWGGEWRVGGLKRDFKNCVLQLKRMTSDKCAGHKDLQGGGNKCIMPPYN